MNEPGIIIAGQGSFKLFRNASRVSAEYGGKPSDWVKKSSTPYTASDGTHFETHWVENIITGKRIEFKTKF